MISLIIINIQPPLKKEVVFYFPFSFGNALCPLTLRNGQNQPVFNQKDKSQPLLMRNYWWKVVTIVLLFYTVFAGMLSPVPRLKILNETNISTIIVTHDSYEAFYMGNKCGIILNQSLKQFDIPYNIYH